MPGSSSICQVKISRSKIETHNFQSVSEIGSLWGRKAGLLKLQKDEEGRQRETDCKGLSVSFPIVAPGCDGKRPALWSIFLGGESKAPAEEIVRRGNIKTNPNIR